MKRFLVPLILLLTLICSIGQCQTITILQTQTSRALMFLMVSNSDHVSGVTGLVSGSTLTVTLSKNGGTFGGFAGTVTEVGNGWYKLAPGSTDTGTLGSLVLHATGTGADPSDKEYNIVAYNSDDPVHLGLSALPNAAAGTGSGLFVGDPLASSIPGSYTSGQAGYVLGNLISSIFTYSLETGVSFQQALRIIAAYTGGNTNATAKTFSALGNPGTTRISFTTGGDGSRTVTATLGN